MNEQLFQYLWEHALFQPSGLYTTDGEPVTVVRPGFLNKDSGPDFKEGKVRIGHTLWIGNIELHLKTSDWRKHGHQHDPAYSNIILHVVFEHDDASIAPDFPTVELKRHIPQSTIERYRQLMATPAKIPCESDRHTLPDFKWNAWLTRLLAERWDQRLIDWQTLLNRGNGNWRELLYVRLAANFGFHVNGHTFQELALSLPLKRLETHKTNLLQLEALLFGQSGLLNRQSATDDYTKNLEQEYHFLRRKYALQPLFAHQWKFLRMRPANFPTIRIAQFAALLHQSLSLFSKMMEVRSLQEALPLFDVTAGAYWDNHYRFGETAKTHKGKKLGTQAIQNILINTVAPLQYLYANQQGKTQLLDTSIALLESLPPESNHLIQIWENAGVSVGNAAESQALLQLFNHYCRSKDCLKCAVGHYLLKKG